MPMFSFPEVRVVEASAGSGKTYALAQRYVQLLLACPGGFQRVSLRNILAITFTNKAAFEMKRRILDFLKKMALDELPAGEEESLLKPLSLSRGEARDKAYAILEALVHQYNYFQVQTIDSFINALLSGCAFKIGLSAHFKIKTNAFEYVEYSLDQMVDRALQDPGIRTVFEKFLYQYIFLENKSSWFPKKDILALLSGLYQQSNTYGQEFQNSALTDQERLKHKKDILGLMRELQAQAGEALDGRFLKSLEKFLAQYQRGFDFDRVSDFFARDELPVKKNAAPPDQAYRLWDDIRARLKALCEEEALTVFDPYIEIFRHIKEDFEQKARKDDLLFLEELNKKARALFDDGAVTVEELYYRLATRFHHYLLDEFQDTSLLQWSNLKMMVEEALSTGGSLFYVGDKKQAIYGFRGGEIRLFDAIQREFAHFNVCREQLAYNYRSQKALVDFNNRIFSLENLRRFIAAKEEFEEEKKKTPVIFTDREFQMLENVYGSSRQSHIPGREAGVVRVEIVVSDRKEERESMIREMLIGRIEDAQRRFPFKDIALLTRSNDEIELLTGWLTEAGIPVQSERTMNIRENRIVQDLIFLLQFLHSPVDNGAFARVVLGDLFLAGGAREKEVYQKYLLEIRVRMLTEKNFVLYRDFRERFPQAWDELFDEFFRQVGLYPLYELMISILHRFDVFARFPGHQGFVMRFLELIKEEEENYTDGASFLEKLDAMENEKLYVHMTDANAVKILTIHKAKGLEFPVVLIPFLGMRIKVGAGGGMGQLSYVLDFKEQYLRLLRIKEKYLKFSGPLYDIWREEYIRAFLFELNSLYVALTRASEELYVFVPNRTGTGFNPAQFLFPDDCMQAGSPLRRERKAARTETRMLLSPPVYQDWLTYLKDEFLDGDKVLRRRAVLRGDIVHAVLSFVGNLDGQDAEKAVALAIRQARVLYPQIGDGLDYQALVCRFILAEQIRPFFYIKEGEVFQEWETVDRQGQTRRIDRLIRGPREIWVADFKSSRDAGEDYPQQVRAYMRLVTELFPEKTVRGFLLYLDAATAEEVVFPGREGGMRP